MKTCEKRNCNRFRVAKYLSDMFPTTDGLKKKNIFYHQCFYILLQRVPLGGFREKKKAIN